LAREGGESKRRLKKVKGKSMHKLILHNLIEKEGELYSAICLELNVASQGTTPEEAEDNLEEAIEVYLENVLETGDEEEFIFRPAPAEEWIKYFEAESLKLKSELLKPNILQNIQFEEVIYK